MNQHTVSCGLAVVPCVWEACCLVVGVSVPKTFAGHSGLCCGDFLAVNILVCPQGSWRGGALCQSAMIRYAIACRNVMVW